MDDTALATEIDDTTATPDEPRNELRGDQLLDDELLVEEISIDGMCGVY